MTEKALPEPQAGRLAALRARLAEAELSALLVSRPENRRYLSGYTARDGQIDESSGHLLVGREGHWLFTDFRYEEQAAHEVKGFEIVIERQERPRVIADFARSAGIRALGFETTASYGFYRSLLRRGFRLKAVANAVEDLRKVKEESELRQIRASIGRAEKAFAEVRPLLRPGVSERRLAGMLADALKKNGCRTLPFDIIVASGPNSAMPHAQPTNRRLRPGDLVVVDWGGEAGGYYSDMTRTFLLNGRTLSRKQEIYGVVLEANRAAVGAVSEGVHSRTVDKAARDVITAAGFGENFGHGTGHGVGLEVHEAPRISRLGRDRIRAGMVFTIEPGIYLPGTGGVRIEDMVVAGADGCTVLTTLPRELEIIY